MEKFGFKIEKRSGEMISAMITGSALILIHIIFCLITLNI